MAKIDVLGQVFSDPFERRQIDALRDLGKLLGLNKKASR
jgi:hypothetical protein